MLALYLCMSAGVHTAVSGDQRSETTCCLSAPLSSSQGGTMEEEGSRQVPAHLRTAGAC